MNRYRPMRQSETVALALFDHPEGMVHHDPEEEIADEYSISFVERSGFEIQVRKKRWQFQQGDVFLTFPGMAYRCIHSDSIPTDRCLAVRYVKPEDSEDFAALARARFFILKRQDYSRVTIRSPYTTKFESRRSKACWLMLQAKRRPANDRS